MGSTTGENWEKRGCQTTPAALFGGKSEKFETRLVPRDHHFSLFRLSPLINPEQLRYDMLFSMEALAVVKTIASLVTSAKTIAVFINDIKDAKKDQKELLTEINATRIILEQLQSHAAKENYTLVMKLLGEKGGLLEQLKTEMEGLGSKIKPRMGRSLVWIFDQTWRNESCGGHPSH